MSTKEPSSSVEELQRVVALLKESEARFRLVLKNIPVMVAALDKDLRFIWAYNQWTVIPVDIIGKTDYDVFPPATAAWLSGLKRQVLEAGKELTDQRWADVGEQHFFLEVFLEPIYDPDGQITGVGSAIVNLTSSKQTEQSLRESEERYRSLFESMSEGFAIHEIIYDESGKPCDYRFLDINPAFERLTGLQREVVLGKTYRQVLPAEGDSWVNTYGHVVLTGIPAEFEQHSLTLNRYYQVFAFRCAPNQFATIFLDITAHKQIEEELKINLTKYAVLFDAFPLGITVTDQKGQILESNLEAERLLGIPLEEHKRRRIRGKEWKIIRPDMTAMPEEEYASVRALKEQRRVEDVEMGVVKGDGQITWISVTASPLPLEGYGVVITYNDISQRIQAEEQLRQAHEKLEITVQERTQELLKANQDLASEIIERKRVEAEVTAKTQAVEAERKRFKDVLEILPVYTILLTPDYHVAFANRYFRERFGEDHGLRCYEYLFGLDKPCGNCETYKVLKTMTNHRWEWLGPDHRNYDVFDFPFSDVDGSSLILELGIDITERKQAEGKLRQLNAYNRSLIESNLDALVTIMPDGKIGDVNAVTEAITGRPRQELIGTDFHSYFTDPRKARLGYEQVFKTGTVREYELEIQHKDGHITPVVYNASIYRDESGKVVGVLAAARDITERKQAEEKLRQLSAYNRSLIEASLDALVTITPDGKIGDVNSVTESITGYVRQELVGKDFHSYFTDPEKARAGYQQVYKTGLVRDYELEIQHRDGHITPVTYNASVYRNESGQVAGVFAAARDITKRKQVEEALRKSEQLYRSLVIATSQIVWQTNDLGEVVEDIPMWRDFTGQSLEECRGKGWLDAVHPADRERLNETWTRAVEARSFYEAECRIRNRHNEYRDFSVRGVPILDPKGNLASWIGTSTDITEKKNYEVQLIQAEKHAVIGRMVGSVTHEINNPLQTIKNCLYLIQQDTQADSPSREPLEIALSETQRLSNIVGQLRQLYRPQAVQTMSTHNLLGIITEVQTLLTPQLSNSHVDWNLSPDFKDCLISCAREQLIEVFLNIGLNAIEAMQPEGGTLSISTIDSSDKHQVGVVIRDTGPGIPAEIINHIFEPFITTKEYGLGLGLSICYGIVQKHGGQIIVESKSGHGTTFNIWLPMVS
jgi:PAS domain S-box-containing protein